ncbi:hypothetical protein FRC12_008080 [Ceratobasidium sp. 428]|nr:hypothetical protein FRC12_008080 [Ceratobasidium sp. 428]
MPWKRVATLASALCRLMFISLDSDDKTALKSTLTPGYLDSATASVKSAKCEHEGVEDAHTWIRSFLERLRVVADSDGLPTLDGQRVGHSALHLSGISWAKLRLF